MLHSFYLYFKYFKKFIFSRKNVYTITFFTAIFFLGYSVVRSIRYGHFYRVLKSYDLGGSYYFESTSYT